MMEVGGDGSHGPQGGYSQVGYKIICPSWKSTRNPWSVVKSPTWPGRMHLQLTGVGEEQGGS